MAEPLRALALVCTLTPSPSESSTVLMAEQLLAELAVHGVTGSVVRVVDHDVKPGVELDMGEGDEWPDLRVMHTTDYKDLDDRPEAVASAMKTAALNAAHLARLLRTDNYPPPK